MVHLVFKSFQSYNQVRSPDGERETLWPASNNFIEVKKLSHFVRTKTWISPNSKSVSHIMEKYELDAAHKFSEKQIQKFREDPIKYTKFLKAIESLSNKRFKTVSFPSRIHIS